MLSLSDVLPASALTRYDDHGEPAYTTYERLLIAMRRMAWSTRDEIFDAMEAHETEDRRLLRCAIAWFVRDGKIESRGVGYSREFRLCAAAFVRRVDVAKCKRCQLPATPGMALCAFHRDWQNEYKRLRFARRQAAKRAAGKAY